MKKSFLIFSLLLVASACWGDSFFLMLCAQGDGPSGAVWHEVWTAESQTGDSTWSDTNITDGRTYVVVIEAGEISNTGTSVRVTFRGRASGSYDITDCYIGERSGTGYSFAAAPTQLQFSAASGVTVAQGTTEVSDNTVFALDSSKSYLVAFYLASGDASAMPHLREASTLNQYYKTTGTSDSSTQTKSGYSLDDMIYGLELLEALY